MYFFSYLNIQPGLLLILLFHFYILQQCLADISEKYCGLKNCYKLLNVSQDVTLNDLKKSYRRLSLIYHPDKNPNQDTTEIYREINHAYEILMDPNMREAYDEYLENPNRAESYHYYKYYKAKYSPEADPRAVVGGFLIFFSVFQYFNRKRMYQNALDHVRNNAKFKTTVTQQYEEEKIKNPRTKKTRKDIEAELLQNVNIYGGYALPKLQDLIGIKILMLPITIICTIWFYLRINGNFRRWIVKFWIMKKPYGIKEKEYLTQKSLKFTEERWKITCLDDATRTKRMFNSIGALEKRKFVKLSKSARRANE